MGKQKLKPRLNLNQRHPRGCDCERCETSQAAANQQIKDRIRSQGLFWSKLWWKAYPNGQK